MAGGFAEIFTTSPTVERATTRRAVRECHFLLRGKKWRKKRANAFLLGTPLVRAQTTLCYFGRAEMGAPLMFARSVAYSDFALAF